MDTAESEERAAPRFRVLSLDGGGIKGTYGAAFLAGLEEATGKRVVDHFDLIVGTSTGGIIAIALGLGVPAADILRFYEERGPDIFPLMTRFSRLRGVARQLLWAKHSPTQLKAALQEVLGDRVIGDSLTRLVVVSYDGTSGDVHLIKTAHHPRFQRDFKVKAVEAGLATSAAPTYLPAFVGSDGTALVDGGVWANCPAAVAVIEALTVLERPFGSIDLLSVGTTQAPLHVAPARQLGGLVQWARFGVELFMQAQTKAALAHAKLLTNDTVHRVTEVVAPGRFSLDDPGTISDLKALGTKAARHHSAAVATHFLSAPVSPFIPYHGPRSATV